MRGPVGSRASRRPWCSTAREVWCGSHDNHGVRGRVKQPAAQRVFQSKAMGQSVSAAAFRRSVPLCLRRSSSASIERCGWATRTLWLCSVQQPLERTGATQSRYGTCSRDVDTVSALICHSELRRRYSVQKRTIAAKYAAKRDRTRSAAVMGTPTLSIRLATPLSMSSHDRSLDSNPTCSRRRNCRPAPPAVDSYTHTTARQPLASQPSPAAQPSVGSAPPLLPPPPSHCLDSDGATLGWLHSPGYD